MRPAAGSASGGSDADDRQTSVRRPFSSQAVSGRPKLDGGRRSGKSTSVAALETSTGSPSPRNDPTGRGAVGTSVAGGMMRGLGDADASAEGPALARAGELVGVIRIPG